jgi:DNA-binding NtrC family response regulator
MGAMPEHVVLVLARDVCLTSALRRMLGREGFDVRTGSQCGQAVRERWPGEDIGAVLVDAGLLAAQPVAELATLRDAFPRALLLAMAGRAEHPVLVVAVQHGALPLTADFDLDDLVDTLRGDDGRAGVREPRRPRLPTGSAAALLDLPLAGGGTDR